ncbi:MAG: DUF3089 domain-containing protein [Proteobacteria bacterium]|nr:DUF3089 domain-containing protein [Pseudomonadota bacterium]
MIGVGQIKGCTHPTDLHCVNAWDTFGEGGTPDEACPHWLNGKYTLSKSNPLCTNPLSWI